MRPQPAPIHRRPRPQRSRRPHRLRAMTSLRSRLILGSALIAILPLALAMFLFSRQVGSMMRAQASERLAAALGGLEAQLGVDGERVAEGLQILGRDATLN